MIKRIFATGWTNFKRNSYLSFSAVGVMSIALILLVSLIGINLLSDKTIASLQEKVDVSVYFKLDANEEQIGALRSETESLAEVKSVEYISREQALEMFKERHKDDLLIQESLGELEDNPLQASLNVKAMEASQFSNIVKSIEGSKFSGTIDSINFFENEDVISRIQAFATNIRNWGVLIMLTLGLIAVLVTFNTIRLTIYNQRKEIEIMKLVGASNWQIRAPYIAEGTFYGLFAALISLAIIYPVLYTISDKIEAFTTSTNLFDYFVRYSYQIIPLVVIVGIALGVTSSFFAIRKHLKV